MIPLLSMLDGTGSAVQVIAYTEEDQRAAFDWLMALAKAIQDSENNHYSSKI